jgi:hypothetical protein
MKVTRTGIAIGLVMMLLMPGSVIGQDASPSVPGAGLDPCTTPVTRVTGTIIWGSEGPDTQRFVTASGEHIRGFAYTSTMSLSDDRLDGTTTASDGVWDQSEEAGIARGNRVIENADGTWEGSETLVGSNPADGGFLVMMDLVGTGAYDGFSAVLFLDNMTGDATIEGSVYPTDLASCDFSTAE